jgi:hypothetical protein
MRVSRSSCPMRHHRWRRLAVGPDRQQESSRRTWYVSSRTELVSAPQTAIATYICTSSTEHLMLAGSHYRILKDDAVRPYTDLAPALRDDACPAFLPRGFLGTFTTFP